MAKLATRRFMGYFGWGFFGTGLVSHDHLSLPDTVKL